MHTTLPSVVRNKAPAPAGPGFPFEAPSNSRIQECCRKRIMLVIDLLSSVLKVQNHYMYTITR